MTLSFRQKKDEKSAEGVNILYYIFPKILDAKEFTHSLRPYWLIEKSIHWMLDVKMNEDTSRIRRENAAEIISEIKYIALNLLRDYKDFKAGMKRIRKKTKLSI